MEEKIEKVAEVELPNDDNPKEPRSLEEIAKAIVEQDKK